MSSPELELLRPLVVNPDDEEARRRYAAWLETQGRGEQARALFSAEPVSNELDRQLRDGLVWATSPPVRTIRGLVQWPSHFRLYCYQEQDSLRVQLTQGLANPGFLWCRRLYIGYSTSLMEEASHALATSPYAENVEELELHEVYVSPAQLEEILTLPRLTNVQLTGGFSQDWGGMTFTWPTVSEAHLQVLARARHLKKLGLQHQEIRQKPAGMEHLEVDVD